MYTQQKEKRAKLRMIADRNDKREYMELTGKSQEKIPPQRSQQHFTIARTWTQPRCPSTEE